METREYLEADLGTAAYLVTKGHRLLGLVESGPGRFAFRFESAACEAALDYLQGDSVPARALVAAMSDLKTLLYQKKEPRNGKRSRER